jgi:hypothetical protein
MNARVYQNGDEKPVGRLAGDDRGYFRKPNRFWSCGATLPIVPLSALNIPTISARLEGVLTRDSGWGFEEWKRVLG